MTLGEQQAARKARSMEILRLNGSINPNGHLQLDIPTQLQSGQVELIVIIAPIPAEQSASKAYNFSDLVGKLTWRGEALEVQRSLRDEWL